MQYRIHGKVVKELQYSQGVELDLAAGSRCCCLLLDIFFCFRFSLVDPVLVGNQISQSALILLIKKTYTLLAHPIRIKIRSVNPILTGSDRLFLMSYLICGYASHESIVYVGSKSTMQKFNSHNIHFHFFKVNLFICREGITNCLIFAINSCDLKITNFSDSPYLVVFGLNENLHSILAVGIELLIEHRRPLCRVPSSSFSLVFIIRLIFF